MSPPELSPTPCEFVVKARMVGKRIDAYLASRYPDYSRSVIQKVIDAGAVLVNGQPIKASYKVRLDDQIRVWLPELADDAPTPEDIPITVVYEDAALTVVNKPAGHGRPPGQGALERHAGQRTPVPLRHAFDRRRRRAGRGSSTASTATPPACCSSPRTTVPTGSWPSSSSSGRSSKEYLALVSGVPERDSDYIERTIGFHPTNREKMAIRLPEDGGKDAVTFYEVLERFRGYALVRCKPADRPDPPDPRPPGPHRPPDRRRQGLLGPRPPDPGRPGRRGCVRRRWGIGSHRAPGRCTLTRFSWSTR